MRRTTDNQAVKQPPRSSAEELQAGPAITASTRFGHDFSHISIQAKANTTIQPKANTPGDIYEQEADQRPVQQHAPLSPSPTLHRVPGNQASGHLVQLKLSVGALDDPYEREADRVADQVIRMPEPRVQRQMDTEEENEEEETDEIIQTKSASQILRHAGVDREGPVQTKSSYTQLPHVAPAIESETKDAEKGVIQLSRGTGKTKKIRGMEFEKDEDGNLIITAEIILKTMQDTYDKYLKDEDKWSGLERVKEVMSKLDTVFYDISRDSTYKRNTFVVDGDPLALEYTAEQVNYLGVGMGFNHFHIFGHFFLTAQAMVLAWNLTEYGHLASPGEHYWADVGFDLYYSFP